MHILVLLKMVPDVVEELEVATDGKSLNSEFLRFIINERDNHALEQALLLKEKYGGTVAVLGPDAPEMDDMLFTALAKGADRALKVSDVEPGLPTSQSAALLAQVLKETPGLLPAELLLTGCQAIDDLDGHLAPLLSHHLGVAYVGVVSQVEVDAAAGKATVAKEFAGGVRGEFEVTLPAMIGIQASEKPPRYVPVAKVRAAMKAQKIETLSAPALEGNAGTALRILKLAKPEVTTHAEMLEGSPEELSEKVLEILTARGLY